MIRRILGCALLTAGAIACAPAGEQAADTSEADLQAVRDVRAQEAAAFNAGEISFAHASPDIMLMPPGEPAAMGTAAATAWGEAFLAEFSVELTYTTDNFFVSGDWAIEPYALTAVLTPVDGGDPLEEVGKGIHIYRRQADGSWKMTHDAWNFDAME
jgi:ketosteroid isomerase-like protein